MLGRRQHHQLAPTVAAHMIVGFVLTVDQDRHGRILVARITEGAEIGDSVLDE